MYVHNWDKSRVHHTWI